MKFQVGSRVLFPGGERSRHMRSQWESNRRTPRSQRLASWTYLNRAGPVYACPNLRRSAGDRRRRQSLYVCPISQRRQCAVLNWSCQAEFPDSAKPTLPG